MRVDAGDRVVVESEKVGQASRHGVVVAAHGDLLTVTWDTGQTSSFVPAAGSLRVER
jgi:hypothetical protein